MSDDEGNGPANELRLEEDDDEDDEDDGMQIIQVGHELAPEKGSRAVLSRNWNVAKIKLKI